MNRIACTAILFLAACAPPIEEGHFSCGSDAECPNDWLCIAGLCYRSPPPGVDAGPTDAGETCVPGANDVDLLVMVDKSGSMSQEQAALAAAFPRLIRALATGDVDGDGTREFERVGSLQIGVITSDLGALGNTVPTCSGSGDDAILIDRSIPGTPGCETYPSFLEFAPGPSTVPLEEAFGCLATVGTAGCGFEQQLEATLKAISTPDTTAVFGDGSTGHGEGANAGFLRPNSLLLTLLVTDEEDCSTLDPDLFNPTTGAYIGTMLNLRCAAHPEALTSVDRYVDGLLELRPDPNQLVFAAFVGMPPELHGSAYDTVLRDPRMTYLDGSGMLSPACSGATGDAYAGRRYIEVARGLEDRGAGTVIRSICQENQEASIDALLTVLAPRLASACP